MSWYLKKSLNRVSPRDMLESPKYKQEEFNPPSALFAFPPLQLDRHDFPNFGLVYFRNALVSVYQLRCTMRDLCLALLFMMREVRAYRIMMT